MVDLSYFRLCQLAHLWFPIQLEVVFENWYCYVQFHFQVETRLLFLSDVFDFFLSIHLLEFPQCTIEVFHVFLQPFLVLTGCFIQSWLFHYFWVLSTVFHYVCWNSVPDFVAFCFNSLFTFFLLTNVGSNSADDVGRLDFNRRPICSWAGDSSIPTSGVFL